MTNLELKDAKRKIAKKNIIKKTAMYAGIFAATLIGGGIPAFLVGSIGLQVFLVTFGIAGIAAVTITGVKDYKYELEKIEKEYINQEYQENQQYIVEEYVDTQKHEADNYKVKGNTYYVDAKKQDEMTK